MKLKQNMTLAGVLDLGLALASGCLDRMTISVTELVATSFGELGDTLRRSEQFSYECLLPFTGVMYEQR